MKILKLAIDGNGLFADTHMELDLYAADRVVSKSSSGPIEVTRVDGYPSLYTLNLIGIGGVNASGKTTTLKLLMFAVRLLQGHYLARGFAYEIDSLPAKLSALFTLRAIFSEGGRVYLLESHIARRSVEDASFDEAFSIEDERLWIAPSSFPKKLLASFDGFQAVCTKLLQRGEHDGWSADLTLSEDILRALGTGASIARFAVSGPAMQSRSLRGLQRRTLPSQVVQAFDPSVEFLVWDADAEVYHLKFRDEPERAMSRDAAASMLSAGTIAGAELVNNAVDVLREGSYMLVDEIEENLNKTLIATVLDLFVSPVTNPHGATLVFSTHYPEILDELTRKDNLYLAIRGEDCRTSLVKYSDCVNRIENKKSEVLLSNLIRGTNPSYPRVRDMRAYVREAVRE